MLIWKLPTFNPRLASVRYRALLPIIALRRLGISSRIYSREEIPNFVGAQAILFVKAFSYHDLALAEEAYSRGVPVVLDLCDNIFVNGYCTENGFVPATVFRRMAAIAALITTTGPALADVLRNEIGNNVAIEIIPDGIETKVDLILATLLAQFLIIRSVILSPKRNMPLAVRQVRKKFVVLVQRLREFIIQRTPLFSGNDEKKSSSGVVVDQQRHQVFSKSSPRIVANTHHISSPCVPLLYKKLARIGRSSTTPLGHRIDYMLSPPATYLECVSSSSPEARRILWFGNWGAAYANFGLSDIMLISDALNEIASKFPFELVIISNNRQVFNQSILHFPFTTRYVEWSQRAVHRWLSCSDVVILPNSCDPFSICKSSNRALLSLSYGVPVVATATPALRALGSDVVLFDDWQTHLCRVLNNPNAERDRTRKAWLLIAHRFSYPEIVSKWCDFLGALPRSKLVSMVQSSTKKKSIGILVTMKQDVDIALDFTCQSKQYSGLHVKLIVLGTVLDSMPWLPNRFEVRKLDVWVISGSNDSIREQFRRELKALIVIAISSLRAHRPADQIVRLANELNIPTYALQHGLENVGISYSDYRHPVKHVHFSVRRVFSWGNDSSWHINISAETRKKLFPVGRIRADLSSYAQLNSSWPNNPVIGVFENLHWHRYSSKYRRRFIADLREVARKYEDSVFLIRSHPEGSWLKSQSKMIQGLSNVFMLDEKYPELSRLPLRVFVNHFDMVITTPSTVALDAAQAGVPVAVACYDLKLDPYTSLTTLRCTNDWATFYETVNSARRCNLLAGGEDFVSRHVLAGDALGRIFDIIQRDLESSLNPAASAASMELGVNESKISSKIGRFTRKYAKELSR